MIPISLVLSNYENLYKKASYQIHSFLSNQRMAGHIGLVHLLRDSKQIVRSMEYIFRAKHSRRMITGTLASSFYGEGVSIQTIRDYLGHNNENMTKQYIDYMPKRIEQANKEYFNQAENLLATGIIPKKRGEKTGK